MLADRRELLTRRRVQTVGRLQALMAELLPGQANATSPPLSSAEEARSDSVAAGATTVEDGLPRVIHSLVGWSTASRSAGGEVHLPPSVAGGPRVAYQGEATRRPDLRPEVQVKSTAGR